MASFGLAGLGAGFVWLGLIFLFYFLRYNIYDVLEFVKKNGFSVDDRPKEGTYTNWENLDEKYTGMHDYFKWIKFVKSWVRVFKGEICFDGTC